MYFFPFPTVIAADDVALLRHLQNPMQNAPPVGAAVENHIVLFAPPFRTGADDEKVTLLPKQRIHTVPYVGIEQLAVDTELLFVGTGLTHPAR